MDPILRNDFSFFIYCLISKQGIVKIRIVPTIIKYMQVNRATGEDHDWCMKHMKELSAEFGTIISDKGNIRVENSHEAVVL